MFRISRDSPVYYLTSVANNRLPVFQTDKLKNLMCDALGEARRSARLLICAYVIMPDHLHALIGSQKKPSVVLRYVNGISGHRVINFLKEKGFESSLQKLKREDGVRQHQYSLWDQHPNLKLITTQNGLMEKANYIHQNPVRAGLVERAEDYPWSSIRCWLRKPLDDEPLLVDIIKSLGIAAEAQPRNIEWLSERQSLSPRNAAKPPCQRGCVLSARPDRAACLSNLHF